MNRFFFTKNNYQNIIRLCQRSYRTENEDRKRAFKTAFIATSLISGAIAFNYYTSQNQFEERPKFFGKSNDKIDNEEISQVNSSNLVENPSPETVVANISIKKTPDYVPYVIIGSGTAGLSAAKAIRASDSCSKVLMIGSSPKIEFGESNIIKMKDGKGIEYYPPPYLRPPLSKQLWRRSRPKMQKLLDSEGDMRSHSWIFYEPDSYFLDVDTYEDAKDGGVFLLSGDPVVNLDTDKRTVTLSSGTKITFDFCLLSTGAKPRRLEAIEKCSETNCSLVNIGKVSYFRSLSDFNCLRDTAENMIAKKGKIAVIGGGFLGCEIACSLSSLQDGVLMKDKNANRNLEVVHLFRETAPMSQVLPPILATSINDFEVKDKSIQINPSCDIVSAKLIENDRIRLRYRQRQIHDGSSVVGVEPNVDLGKSGSLELDENNGGILVNAEMESRAGIYAAGDVASYYDPVLGFRRRVEHLNFAEETGSIAGKNMAIASLKLQNEFQDKTLTNMDTFQENKFKHQSSVWSALGQGLTWDGVGLCDAKNLITKSFFVKTEKPLSDKSEQGVDLDKSQPESVEIMQKSNETLQMLDSDYKNRQGVVYYLNPKDRRIVGILLWNLEDDYFSDDEINVPSRLNMARKLLSEKIKISNNEEGERKLLEITRKFDLGMKIHEDYEELKLISAEAEKKFHEENKKIPKEKN